MPIDRHARQLVLPEVQVAGQRALRNAKVVVIGCGGLGAPVISQLAAAGVGHLTLVDDDVVEPSNLNRQTLFGEADVGQRKAVVAADSARAIDSSLDVTAVVERVVKGNAHKLIEAHDIVVDCSDGLPTKYLLNDTAVVVDRVLVHGAATAWAGQVLTVPGRRGPCLRCLFPTIPPRDSVPTCRTAGIVAPVTGVVGSLQAAAVLKCVLRIDDVGGRFSAVDVKDGVVRVLRFARDASCPACGDAPTVANLRDADYDLPTCEDA